MKLYFRQAEFIKIYKREEYDMLTYLGDMGGLLDIIIFVGMCLSSSIVSRLFYAALVKQTYRIQQYMKDMTPYYESKKKNGDLTTESDSKDSDDTQMSSSDSD